MKKEDMIYYGLLFSAGVVMALWFRKEYFQLKEASMKPKSVKYAAFGVRG